MAGFEVATHGRFWVATEALTITPDGFIINPLILRVVYIIVACPIKIKQVTVSNRPSRS